MVITADPTTTPATTAIDPGAAAVGRSGPPAELLPAGGRSISSRDGVPDADGLRQEIAETARLVMQARSSAAGSPGLLTRPEHGPEVGDVLAHLAPIRTRVALLSSYRREAARTERVRLAYALAWLALGHGMAAASVRRHRAGTIAGVTRGG